MLIFSCQRTTFASIYFQGIWGHDQAQVYAILYYSFILLGSVEALPDRRRTDFITSYSVYNVCSCASNDISVLLLYHYYYYYFFALLLNLVAETKRRHYSSIRRPWPFHFLFPPSLIGLSYNFTTLVQFFTHSISTLLCTSRWSDCVCVAAYETFFFPESELLVFLVLRRNVFYALVFLVDTKKHKPFH